jgi:hypothetical protein
MHRIEWTFSGTAEWAIGMLLLVAIVVAIFA